MKNSSDNGKDEKVINKNAEQNQTAVQHGIGLGERYTGNAGIDLVASAFGEQILLASRTGLLNRSVI